MRGTWDLLDGINDAALAVSLAFGGRKVVGSGFGVPLVVRYVLETCETTEQARATLRRLPYHLAHTLTVADASGDVCTAFLAPDRDVILSDAIIATNHQGDVEWQEHAAATRTLEREECLVRLLERETTTPEQFVSAFLRPPLYQHGYGRGMGTLYTAALPPRRASGRLPVARIDVAAIPCLLRGRDADGDARGRIGRVVPPQTTIPPSEPAL